MNKQEKIESMTWFAKSWTVTELLDEGNTHPDDIPEIVGDWVDDELNPIDDDEKSELCSVFYNYWGSVGIDSHTPEWEGYWMNLLSEEQEG
jgi:hypothetical protein